MHRRSFLTGIAVAVAAPAIVRSGILMPIRGIVQPMDYGISPMIVCLDDLRAEQARIRRWFALVAYIATPEWPASCSSRARIS